MGSCTRRHFLLSICILQLLSIIERQTFDFLGYMWAPIFVNFFHIIFVIFGFFGAYQYRPKYLITYSLWSLLWIGWNTFLICFYLNIGILDRDSDLLNLGTGSVSWFEVNGYGCKPSYPTNITSEDPYRPVRPEKVEGCLLEYHIIEITQSGLQCMLALFGLIGAICIGQTYLDEDDSFDFMGGDAKSPQHTAVHPMYVSYTSLPTSNSATSTQINQNKLKNNICISNNSNSNKFGVVLKSINNNNASNTNTILSSSSSQNHENHIPLHQQHNHPLNRNPSFSKNSRKNSNLNVRYTDIMQEHQLPHNCASGEDELTTNEDDTYFIPKSLSFKNNFGINNPFNNMNKFYNHDDDDDNFGDDDDEFNRPITSNQQPMSTTTPLKKIHNVQNSTTVFDQKYSLGMRPEFNPVPSNRVARPMPKQIDSDSYKMPYQYVTRSPNLNRISRRNNNSNNFNNNNLSNKPVATANFCDQIRDAPPGYNENCQNIMVMHRAKSQDRLTNRSRRQANRQFNHQNQQRPRSFCSNNGVYPDYIHE